MGAGLALAYRFGAYLLQCTLCMVAIAIVVAWVAGDIHGHRKSDAACRAADLAMQLKAKERDVRIANDTAAAAAAEAQRLEGVATDLQGKVSTYEKTLAKRPACTLTPDDVSGLQRIG